MAVKGVKGLRLCMLVDGVKGLRLCMPTEGVRVLIGAVYTGHPAKVFGLWLCMPVEGVKGLAWGCAQVSTRCQQKRLI